VGEPAISRYALCALAAAALFGASTPIAKALVADIHPVVLAALLYLGSGGAPLAQPQQRTP
jgi:drug/metabolite transporter (DMT)-like permease